MTKTGCKKFGWLQNIWTCCNFSSKSYIENFILTSQMLMRVMITFSILSKLSPFFPPLNKQHGQNRMLNCEKRLEYRVPFISLLHVWTLKIYKPWYHAKGTQMLLAWDNNTMQNPFWWILIATLYILRAYHLNVESWTKWFSSKCVILDCYGHMEIFVIVGS